MALPLQNEDEDRENSAREGEPQQLGTESAVIQAPSTPGGSPTQGSGQYTNLQSYLDANQGSKMGEKLASNVTNTITNAKNASTAAQSGFEGQVNAGSVTPSERVFQDVQDNPTNLGQDEISDFKKIRDARYQGPNSFVDDKEDYSNAYKANQAASEESKAAETEEGRFGLLQKYYNRDDYTPGQQKLDQLLVQNDPTSRAAFENVSSQNAQQQENYKGLQDRLNQYAATSKASTQAGRTQARSLIGIDDAGNATGEGLLGTARQGVESRTQQQINKRNSDFQTAQEALKTGHVDQLTPEQRQQLGIDPNSQLYRMSEGPESFLSQNNDWNTETLATPEEQAKYRALSDLAGTGGEFLSGSNVGSQANNPGYSFNQEGFHTAQQAAQANYQQRLNAVQPAGTNGFSSPMTLQQQSQWLQQYLTDAGPHAQNAGTAEAQRKLAMVQSQIQRINDEFLLNTLSSGNSHPLPGNWAPTQVRT